MGLTAKGGRAGSGAAMVAGAGGMALSGTGAPVAALVPVLAEFMPAWVAALVVAAALFAVAGPLALFGGKQVKQTMPRQAGVDAAQRARGRGVGAAGGQEGTRAMTPNASSDPKARGRDRALDIRDRAQRRLTDSAQVLRERTAKAARTARPEAGGAGFDETARALRDRLVGIRSAARRHPVLVVAAAATVGLVVTMRQHERRP